MNMLDKLWHYRRPLLAAKIAIADVGCGRVEIGDTEDYSVIIGPTINRCSVQISVRPLDEGRFRP